MNTPPLRRLMGLPAVPAVLATLLLLLLTACVGPPRDVAREHEGDDLIIVAVREGPSSLPAVGGSARGDYRRARYFGSDAALALAQAIANERGLSEVAAWTIQPLGLRCMLYRLPPGADRETTLATLRRDPRVALAQPQNHFETLAETTANPQSYNDPLLPQQHALLSIGALAAQQWGQGEGISVAVIDGAIDATHPELSERVVMQRDFVRPGTAAEGTARTDRHGTAVAGVIAASANNGVGIVGVAPRAKLLALRACWPVQAGQAGQTGQIFAARCSTFSLAQAMVAAIGAGADVINLSLGGPRDALLEQLASYAMARGAVVVGALPVSGRAEGFPAGVPGVLVAAVAEDSGLSSGSGGSAGNLGNGGVFAAPGRQVLSLVPGGAYAMSHGSSIAAAHLSGAVALLKSIKPDAAGAERHRLLTGGALATTAAMLPSAAPPSLQLCALGGTRTNLARAEWVC